MIYERCTDEMMLIVQDKLNYISLKNLLMSTWDELYKGKDFLTTRLFQIINMKY